MVVLVFLHIKRETYTHIYDDFKDIKNTIESILNGESIKQNLNSFYRVTLEEFNNFIQINKTINLNL